MKENSNIRNGPCHSLVPISARISCALIETPSSRATHFLHIPRKRVMMYVATFILHTLFFILHTSPVQAANMESTRFQIHNSAINIGGGNASSSNYGLSTTLGQTAAGQFDSEGFALRAGFQYLHSVIPFTFSVSKSNLTLNNIEPNKPQTTGLDLHVTYGSAGGYQVATQALGPLRTFDGFKSIPHTICNTAKKKCTSTKAAQWNSDTSFGFGYSVKGDSVTPDFIDSSFYRPFADENLNQSPAVIMQSTNVTRSANATVTLKVNVPPRQATGIYTTVLNFIATPMF